MKWVDGAGGWLGLKKERYSVFFFLAKKVPTKPGNKTSKSRHFKSATHP